MSSLRSYGFALLPLALSAGYAAPAAAQQLRRPVSNVRPAAGPLSSPDYCSATASAAIANVQLSSSGQRISCARDPGRPVIILVHGLHQNMKTWTAPSDVEYAYDLARLPSEPTVGVGRSPWLYGSDKAAWDRRVNWFDFLAAQGLTVATWSQPGLSIADAWDSAVKTTQWVLDLTRNRNPSVPPPVAFIGHSRGGLLIRKLLKEQRTMAGMERVKWVVTLHSPHQGSELGRYPGRMASEITDVLDCCIPDQAKPFTSQLKALITEAMRPLTKIVVDFESRELMPDGPMLRDLTNGETPMPGVKYYTFGGTKPTFFRLYLRLVGQNAAVELTPLSPILDGFRDFVDEVKPGRGDGLVSNASSRLSWSTHFTTNLNHAEVLWDRGLQQQVLGLLRP